MISGKNVTFYDEIDALKTEVFRLKSDENVTIFIALGHSGHLEDIRIAQSVPGHKLIF